MDRAKCGKFKFVDAVEIFLTRLLSAKDLKPRSKAYRMERLAALQRSWEPSFEATAAQRRMRRRQQIIVASYTQAELWP